jgi:hypothetical protein
MVCEKHLARECFVREKSNFSVLVPNARKDALHHDGRYEDIDQEAKILQVMLSNLQSAKFQIVKLSKGTCTYIYSLSPSPISDTNFKKSAEPNPSAC